MSRVNPATPRWWGSVRMRTALAAALALAGVLAIGSVAGVVYQRHQLTDGVALIAEEQARTVAAGTSADGSTLASSLGGESTLVQVVDADGRVLLASAGLKGQDALVDPRAVSGPTRRTVTNLVNGEGDRYVAVAVPAPGGRIAVAAQSLETVDTATSSTIGLLAIGDPLLVLLVGALSYVLVGRALRPVESVRAQAAEITAADLSARLPVVRTGDEIERLSVTLNEMLGRLEASAEVQRRFVADASHELRSPVATIRTLHEVAGAVGDDVDWPTLSVDVLAETERLERLVADLLLLARSGTETPKPSEVFDLSVVVREEACRARSLPVTAAVPPGVLVQGQPDALARALRNVLDNAERHTRSLLAVTLTTHDARAVLSISDDGDGIAFADRERVFDRFVRLDEARTRDDGGSGLGLAITRYLVEEQGGTIRVEDTDVRGALVVIEVPLADT